MNELKDIKGLGPKSISLLNKVGINDLSDLVEYYPFRYDHIKRSNMNDITDDSKVIIDGVIETVPSVFYFNRKLDKMSFKLNIKTKVYNVVIFNRGFLKTQLKIGTEVTVIGKIDKKKNTITASNINMGLIKEERIDPVYHITYGISNKQVKKIIYEALKLEFKCQNYLPNGIIDKYHFLDKKTCLNEIHNPKNITRLYKVRSQLKYEELFLFMMKMNYLKTNKNNKIGLKRDVDFNEVKDMIKYIPFELTVDQIKSVENIYKDLIEPKRMNRLLQGDVGSGKTIVALIACYINYLSGYQSALMAPTEILASQHYENAVKLFEKYDLNICLLTGKTKNKKQIKEQLQKGEIDLIIGTHALFTGDVIYNNLGLVITDEQHRFGVNQRSSLKNKGLTPDILYMSATPIPRTYALTLYGDMDISNIKTMPGGRKQIITELKSDKEIKDVLSSMYRELKNDHQVYVIAPLIEESEKIDLTNIYDLEEKFKKAFGKIYNIGILHGKMSDLEKEEVMQKFKDNKIQILISTTVIEVGIDVKNATMMVIFDSFRFGLSALHQLRGRVGRSQLQSYCLLISNKETKRLDILTKTNDGFKISEEDFLLRGSGDVFGQKQSGDMVFKIADLKKDYKILLKAKEDSMMFLAKKDKTKEEEKLYNFISNFSNMD